MKHQKLLLAALFVFAFTLGIQTTTSAQYVVDFAAEAEETPAEAGTNYATAVGLRLGYPLSLSLKKFFTEDIAGEAYIGFRGFSGYSWVNIAVAVQKHAPIDAVDGLQWYYGAGASVFFFNFDNDFFGDSSTTTSFGVQGYIGLDYTFADIPLNLSLDWIPTIFINGFGSGFSGSYGSLAARYVIE